MTHTATVSMDLAADRLAADGASAEHARAGAARVLWSCLVEPGDAVAGLLVAALGPVESIEVVGRALVDGGESDAPVQAIVERCIAARAFGAGETSSVVRAVRAAAARWRVRYSRADPARVLRRAAAVGATLLVPEDAAWPARLADLGANAPIVLWTRTASAEALRRPSLAVVGSRANSAYGADVAAATASEAVGAGVVVVSGGAYGIDAVAHRAALRAGGLTVAVLAGGVDQLYPAGNAELLRHISGVGAVVAESPPGTRPTRWRFLARNRLIAALACGVVVVEAGVRSGALNTAHHAAQIGRQVWAAPGPLTAQSSAGCHRLIAAGMAEIMIGPAQPCAGIAPSAARAEPSAEPQRQRGAEDEVTRALDALSGTTPVREDEVARRSGMSVRQAMGALAVAELDGLASHEEAGWRRVAPRRTT